MAISGVVGAIYKSSGVSITTIGDSGFLNTSGDHKRFQIDTPSRQYFDRNSIITVKRSLDFGVTWPIITTGFTIEHAGGFIVFDEAQPNDVGVVGTGIKYFPLTQIGGGFNWSLDMKIDTLECSTFENNGWKSYIPSTRGFSGSFEKYFLNEERKNLLPSFDKWTLHANAVATGDYSLTLNATASNQLNSFVASVSPNTSYSLSFGSITGGANAAYSVYDYSSGSQGTIIVASDGTLLNVNFTTSPGVTKVIVFVTSNTTGTLVFNNPQLEKGSVATTFSPRSCLAESIGNDMILVLYTDSGTSKSRYEGYAKITGVSTETPNDDLVKESLDFQGDSKLYYREG